MLQRLFIFLLLFLVLPDLYLYLRFIVRLTAKWWLRVLYWVPSFLLTAGLLYLVYFANNAFALPNGKVEVKGGLQAGETVAVSKLRFLSEGTSVEIMAQKQGMPVTAQK